MMAHVIDVDSIPHHELGEDFGDNELHVDTSADATGSQSELTTMDVRSPPVSRSLPSGKSATMASLTSKRGKFITTVVTIFTVLVATLGIVIYSSTAGSSAGETTNNTNPGTNTNTNTDTDTNGPVITVTPQVSSDSLPFLSLSLENPHTPVFVLAKSYWNESFMVYPTVVKHSQPPHAGMERGSILLDTHDYVFHFEKSTDDRYLFLVLENHLARLDDEDDELKMVFEDSQWPGYVTRVAIYMETDDAYYFSSDTFLSHGFYVSWKLMTPYFTVLPSGCDYYPRNSNLQIEYEMDNGVVWVNYAIGLLPETVMDQRAADDRVGYFMQRYIRYGVDNQDPVNATAEGYQYMDTAVTVINRRRLERDDATGKTKEPIVYYIDPSVPMRWRDAFVEGVMAWAPAFEAIGFKDAIKAVQPGDSDWPSDYRIGDLRYNSISVMISDETYAIGPIVFDPRSGEILHSDITFEYGFFDEVVADFNVRSPVGPPPSSSLSTSSAQAAINASRTTSYNTPRQCGLASSEHHQLDRMILGMLLGTTTTTTKSGSVPESIIARHFVDIVMHEVGHTLGLRHNFAGTAQVTRKDLANKNYTSTNGLSTSIMDYISVNIFSDLTETAAKSHDFYQSVIGSYDKAAIAYGYAIVEDETHPGLRSEQLSRLAQAAPLFLTDEDADMLVNPYAQRFDISSDPIGYANDRLELVKTLRGKKLASKLADDAPWSNLWHYEHTLLRLINSSISTVQPFLGGVNVTHAHRKPGQMSFSVPFVPEKDQLRALDVLARVIRADEGLFPAPSEYASYIQVVGYKGEDCLAASNDFGCLARALVDLDGAIKTIRENAVISALFPVLDRIIAQDVNSPLTMPQVLSIVETAASFKPNMPRNQVIHSFFHEILVYLLDSKDEDSRLQTGIMAFVNATFG